MKLLHEPVAVKCKKCFSAITANRSSHCIIYARRRKTRIESKYLTDKAVIKTASACRDFRITEIFFKGAILMKQTKFRKLLFCALAFVLIAVMALSMFGCAKENKTPETTAATTQQVVSTEAQKKVLGEGETTFYFNVTDNKGKFSAFEIHTDKTNVGEALQELKLIDGDESEYGLYVKKVNNVTLDFDKDGMYWAFYENGAYATKGVDQTEIKDGATYEFKAEK